MSMGRWRLDCQEDMPTKALGGVLSHLGRAHTCSFVGEEVASGQLQTFGAQRFPLLRRASQEEGLSTRTRVTRTGERGWGEGRLPGDGGQDTYRGKALLPPGRFGGQVRNRVHKATHRRLLTPGPKIVEGQ